MNIWLHLQDETCPQPIKDYIRGVCELKRNNLGLMMHTKWRKWITFFYETHVIQSMTSIYGYSYKGNQLSLRFYDIKEIPDNFDFLAMKVFDSNGLWIQTNLFKKKEILSKEIVKEDDWEEIRIEMEADKLLFKELNLTNCIRPCSQIGSR